MSSVVSFVKGERIRAVKVKKQLWFNGRFLTQGITGVQRFAMETVLALDALIESGDVLSGVELVIVTPKGARRDLPLKHIVQCEIGQLTGHAWEQFELSRLSIGIPLINLCNTAPAFKREQVVVIHDASISAVPEAFGFAFRAWYQILLRLLGRFSRSVVTVSEFSRHELSRYFAIPLEKITVVVEGWQQFDRVASDHSILSKFDLGARPYLLAVSSMSPHKNFASIVAALEFIPQPNFDVVIAGGTNPRVFKQDGAELPSYVKHIGYVTDAMLKALYEHAACFIYPSLYEGFGLPPLEAMACGCPVIVSNRASLPEICGDAALYVDPLSPKDIAEKICLGMQNDGMALHLKAAGKDRARLFSWDLCAKGLWQVISDRLLQESTK